MTGSIRRLARVCLLACTAWLAASAAMLAAADKKTSGTGLPVPRFISIASKTANMRTGPGKRYPVIWVYKRPGVPVMVVDEFEHWRKVLDVEGTEGWFHKSLLSGRRTAIVTGSTRGLHRDGDDKSPVVFRAEKGVIGRLNACIGSWCQMEVGDLAGWISRGHIYGALPGENFD